MSFKIIMTTSVTTNKTVFHNTIPDLQDQDQDHDHSVHPRPIFTLRAKLSGAVYCYRSCLCARLKRAGSVRLCVCMCYCLCVCGSVTTITRNCVHRSSPNWVCIRKGSDHLQLIKFWPSRRQRRREGGLRRANFFLAPPYYSQRAVFASPLSAFSFWSEIGFVLRPRVSEHISVSFFS